MRIQIRFFLKIDKYRNQENLVMFIVFNTILAYELKHLLVLSHVINLVDKAEFENDQVDIMILLDRVLMVNYSMLKQPDILYHLL